MKDTWTCSKNGKGMATSIGLHLFFLGLVYCIQLTPGSGASSGQAYTIALKPATAYIEKIEATNTPSQNGTQEAVKPSALPKAKSDKTSKKHLKNRKRQLRPQQHNPQQPAAAKARQNIVPSNKLPKIDERGLYHVGKNHAKQAGATLELTGWEWDAVPMPKDTTEECGKIVFEIKVDENGEVISIQTIEKTVTPMVEKIYADALRGLTFSKTSDVRSYARISTGKVSFILVAK